VEAPNGRTVALLSLKIKNLSVRFAESYPPTLGPGAYLQRSPVATKPPSKTRIAPRAHWVGPQYRPALEYWPTLPRKCARVCTLSEQHAFLP